ncbi:hypothetical protein [Escherichia coli]|uniref:hypothetical protein n=1 Tax=Escherichia coli TaxID=562 RepID=UPI0035B5EEE2
MRLFYLNHFPYSWHWNVRFRPQEAVYISNDTCHITITCNQSGFHLTRDGQRLFTERYIRNWICPYISRHLLSLNPLQARCRRYSRGER